jgi:hypothetical protein
VRYLALVLLVLLVFLVSIVGLVTRAVREAGSDPAPVPEPAHLQHFGGLYIRAGGQIVDAPAEDVDVAKRYPQFPDKGPVVGGARKTILTAKTVYRVGEPVRVIHVYEAVEPGSWTLPAGPKEIEQEYVDGREAHTDPLGGYDGPMVPAPAVDYNYEITQYRFASPGPHTICWGGPDGYSNVLRILVQE